MSTELVRLNDLDMGMGLGSSMKGKTEIRPMAELGATIGVSGVEAASGEIKGLGDTSRRTSDIKGLGSYRRDARISCPPGCSPNADDVIAESKDEKYKKLEQKLGVVLEKAEGLVEDVSRRRDARKMKDVFGEAKVDVYKPKAEGWFETVKGVASKYMPHKEPKPKAFEGTGIDVV